MAKITLNKDLTTEFEMDFDSFNEDIGQNILSTTKMYKLEPGVQPPTIPTLPSKDITTIELTSGGIVLPLAGTYNKVFNYNASYSEIAHTYSVYLTIGYEA